MTCQLEVNNLYFAYQKKPLFNGLNLQLGNHGVTGLLGLNGQGKSTLLKILAGILPAKIDLNCEKTTKKSHHIGYLAERPLFYPELTVHENVVFAARLNGVADTELEQQVDSIISQTQLSERSKQLAGTLSKGYQQRLGLAMATVHQPAFLILDEPTDGLDPKQVEETHLLIKKFAENSAIIISSHRLDEISRLCQRILILHHGKLVSDSLVNSDEQREALASQFHQITSVTGESSS